MFTDQGTDQNSKVRLSELIQVYHTDEGDWMTLLRNCLVTWDLGRLPQKGQATGEQ